MGVKSVSESYMYLVLRRLSVEKQWARKGGRERVISFFKSILSRSLLINLRLGVLAYF